MQILLHALHTHPDFWGADALTFNPDRWLPDAPPRVRDTFIPFLEGIRRCAGMLLAKQQCLILTYVLLVCFDVRVALPDVDGVATSLSNPKAHASAATEIHDVPDDVMQSRLILDHGPRHHAPYLEEGTRWKLRMRADMFSAYDGRIPFTMSPL